MKELRLLMREVEELLHDDRNETFSDIYRSVSEEIRKTSSKTIEDIRAFLDVEREFFKIERDKLRNPRLWQKHFDIRMAREAARVKVESERNRRAVKPSVTIGNTINRTGEHEVVDDSGKHPEKKKSDSATTKLVLL